MTQRPSGFTNCYVVSNVPHEALTECPYMGPEHWDMMRMKLMAFYHKLPKLILKQVEEVNTNSSMSSGESSGTSSCSGKMTRIPTVDVEALDAKSRVRNLAQSAPKYKP